MQDQNAWPDIPYSPWAETCSALHLYSQIVGKYRLAHTPWINHGWHATLYVDADGMTSGLIPDAGGIAIRFDLHAQSVIGIRVGAAQREFALEPMTVGYRAFGYTRFRHPSATAPALLYLLRLCRVLSQAQIVAELIRKPTKNVAALPASTY